MPFGYMPHKIFWKDKIAKIIGWPNMMRRLQGAVIMRMLEASRDDIILDAGCGGGNFAFEMAKKSKGCVGIDININEKASFAMENASNLSFLKGDVQKLPLKGKSFDKVLLSSVLQMVQDDIALLKECHRVLRKNGILVLSVPIKYIWLKSLDKIKNQLRTQFGARGKGFYRLDEVTGLLENQGYNIVETEYAPKRWGSLVYELWLFICYRFGLPLSSPYYFFLLYSLAFLDKVIGSKNQKGNEVVIKAMKIG